MKQLSSVSINSELIHSL